jgi:hypothetical protein
MAEDIVNAYAITTQGQSQTLIEHRSITRYEVWKEKTLVLRTVHQAQAIRYAKEIEGEVHTVAQAGYTM